MELTNREFKIGTDQDFVHAEIIDLGIPGSPKLIVLASRGHVEQNQKLELLRQIEIYCSASEQAFSLIAQESMFPGFSNLVGSSWMLESAVQSYSFVREHFRAVHDHDCVEVENLESDVFTEYMLTITKANKMGQPEALQRQKAKWKHFSSTLYAQYANEWIVSVAEVHSTPGDRFSIDLLGTVDDAKNQGHATRLYSYVIDQILTKTPEHIGVTDANNLAMQRVFQKLGGTMTDVQHTWKWDQQQSVK